MSDTANQTASETRVRTCARSIAEAKRALGDNRFADAVVAAEAAVDAFDDEGDFGNPHLIHPLSVLGEALRRDGRAIEAVAGAGRCCPYLSRRDRRSLHLCLGRGP